MAAAAAAESLQSCLTLCDPVDSSPPGSPVPGILQARTLEWVAISFSNVWKWEVKVKSLSRVWLFATPWTAAHQAPPSMGFSSKSTGVGCHCLLWPYGYWSINPVNLWASGDTVATLLYAPGLETLGDCFWSHLSLPWTTSHSGNSHCSRKLQFNNHSKV